MVIPLTFGGPKIHIKHLFFLIKKYVIIEVK